MLKSLSSLPAVRVLDGSKLGPMIRQVRATGGGDQDVNDLVNRELTGGVFPELSPQQVAADVHASAAARSVRIASETLARIGRNGWDGKGSPFDVLLHVPGRDGNAAGGAMWWTGRNIAVLSDGDNVHSRVPYAAAADVLAHEIGHGVWYNSLYPESAGDPGHFTKEALALSESFGDVVGLAADPGDWLIGEEVGLDGKGGTSFIRDALHPPLTHRSQVTDPEKVDQWTLSGLPTLAAARSAGSLGRDGVAKIWLQAIERGDYRPGGGIEEFAEATVAAAQRVAPSVAEAVADAWRSVGYLSSFTDQGAA